MLFLSRRLFGWTCSFYHSIWIVLFCSVFLFVSYVRNLLGCCCCRCCYLLLCLFAIRLLSPSPPPPPPPLFTFLYLSACVCFFFGCKLCDISDFDSHAAPSIFVLTTNTHGPHEWVSKAIHTNERTKKNVEQRLESSLVDSILGALVILIIIIVTIIIIDIAAAAISISSIFRRFSDVVVAVVLKKIVVGFFVLRLFVICILTCVISPPPINPQIK